MEEEEDHMIHYLHEWEEKYICFLERRLPFCALYARRYQRLLRYLAAGGTAAIVDIGLLYVFTDLFNIHYLWSAVWAFVGAFFVSFLLQKFWTFQDTNTDRMHVQMALYLFIALLNLLLNTFLMYLFVDKVHMWYIAAQILASGLIACESFFISRMMFSRKTQ